MVARTRVIVTLYVQSLSCVIGDARQKFWCDLSYKTIRLHNLTSSLRKRKI